MNPLCLIFRHDFGDWLSFGRHNLPNRGINTDCYQVRLCRRCGAVEENRAPQHDFVPLPSGLHFRRGKMVEGPKKAACKSFQQCLRCDYTTLIAPHQFSNHCRCSVCGEIEHQWDGCRCRRCGAEEHKWKGCVCHRCQQTHHERDGKECRCRICGQPAHELQGCKCLHCGRVEHLLRGCRCTRCGATQHDFDFGGVHNGYFYHCRRCRSYMHCESGNVTEI